MQARAFVASLALLVTPARALTQDDTQADLGGPIYQDRAKWIDARMRRSEQDPAPEDDINTLQGKISPELQARIADPESYWTLLTDPATAFEDRHAAAQQGRTYFTLDQLPRVMAALGELRAEQRLHAWGLRPNPSSAV